MSNKNNRLCDGRMIQYRHSHPTIVPFGGIWGIRQEVVMAGAAVSYPVFRMPSLDYSIDTAIIRIVDALVGTANADLTLELHLSGDKIASAYLINTYWTANTFEFASQRLLYNSLPLLGTGVNNGRFCAKDQTVDDSAATMGSLYSFGQYSGAQVTLELTLGTHTALAGTVEIIMAGRAFE